LAGADEFADVKNLHRSIDGVVAKNAASMDGPSESGLFGRVARHSVTPRGNRRARRYVGFALTFSLARAAAVSASDSVPASWQGRMSELLAFPAARIRDGTGISLSTARAATSGTRATASMSFTRRSWMIRESLSPGSPHVILDVKPDNSVEFKTRSTLNGETRFIAGTGPSNHPWARRRSTASAVSQESSWLVFCVKLA
jgi:hypothetical protein